MCVTLSEKGFDFSIRIAELVKYLRENDKFFPLCDRLLCCGVIAGLCMRGGKTREAAELVGEADYIIEMAVVAGYMTQQQGVPIRTDCESLLKNLNSKQRRHCMDLAKSAFDRAEFDQCNR